MRAMILVLGVLMVAMIVGVPAAYAMENARFKALPERLQPQVRVVHASPDAPPVDVRVDGAVAFSDLEFTEVGEYARLPAGTYAVDVVPTGADEPVVIDADLSLRPFRDYTIVAVDTLENIEPIVLIDQNKWVPPGMAKVRFVHASPDAPAVDIAVADGPILFHGIEFKQASNYLRVPGGSYDLEVRLAGTDTVVLELAGIGLDEGAVYTAFAVGLVGEGTLGAVLSEDARPQRFAFAMR